MKTHFPVIIPVLSCLLFSGTAKVCAQLCAQLDGTTFVEDFNNLAVSGTSNTISLGAYSFAEAGSGGNITYAASDGSVSTANTYSFGTGTNTDRAFGEVTGGTLQSTLGFCFVNNTGLTIYSVFVSYTGEQWRLGAADTTIDRLDFQYSTTAPALNSGTWVDVNSLDFTAPNNSGVSGPLNGNAAANRNVFSPTEIAFPNGIVPGGVFFIRWVPFNTATANDGLAIDDFKLTVRGFPQWNGTANGNWSAGAMWINGPPRNGDVLVFAAGSATGVNDVSGLILRALKFIGTGYNLTGNPVSLIEGIDDTAPAGASSFNPGITLTHPQKFTSSGPAGAGLTLGGPLNLNSFVLTYDTASARTSQINGVVGGSGSLIKDGAGSLTLTGSNTYSGTTTINAGTLLVNGNNGPSPIVVAKGTLGGTGQTGRILAIDGAVAPGAGAGTLTAGGDVYLGSGATLNVDIGGLNPGTQFDRLSVNGSIHLAGATLTGALINGFNPVNGNQFTIIQSTGLVSGAFAGGDAVTIGGKTFVVTYNPNSVILSIGPPTVVTNFKVTRGSGAQADLDIIAASGTAEPGGTVQIEKSGDLRSWLAGDSTMANGITGAWALNTTEPYTTIRRYFRFRRL